MKIYYCVWWEENYRVRSSDNLMDICIDEGVAIDTVRALRDAFPDDIISYTVEEVGENGECY